MPGDAPERVADATVPGAVDAPRPLPHREKAWSLDPNATRTADEAIPATMTPKCLALKSDVCVDDEGEDATMTAMDSNPLRTAQVKKATTAKAVVDDDVDAAGEEEESGAESLQPMSARRARETASPRRTPKTHKRDAGVVVDEVVDGVVDEEEKRVQALPTATPAPTVLKSLLVLLNLLRTIRVRKPSRRQPATRLPRRLHRRRSPLRLQAATREASRPVSLGV